jgi:hypothetical protein
LWAAVEDGRVTRQSRTIYGPLSARAQLDLPPVQEARRDEEAAKGLPRS